MPLQTTNIYGNITISDQAVALIAGRVALECYGVVELSPRRFSSRVKVLFKHKPINCGIKVITMDNRIFLDLYVIISKGVNENAVTESLRSSVEYNVANLTGMRVKCVNVHVVGYK
jgi:uncharacterized alkaline shock family protein YloU